MHHCSKKNGWLIACTINSAIHGVSTELPLFCEKCVASALPAGELSWSCVCGVFFVTRFPDQWHSGYWEMTTHRRRMQAEILGYGVKALSMVGQLLQSSSSDLDRARLLAVSARSHALYWKRLKLNFLL